ncbi:MAG: T9SS type A sorting domain-containing protein [Chitinophagales bacterium]|nr:T9SS type A sorting domain-containing protein [Chitinophagales bacterium]
MKHKIITLSFCAIVLLIFFNGTSNTQSPCDSPYVGGHTGAPGETGCNGCHAGTANAGTATIDFDLGTSAYVPGQTYQGFVRIQQSGFDKFGFSCLALKNSDNTTIGSFGLLETVRTRTYADGNRNYVSHTPCGADSLDANSWNFTWTAPNTNQDTITLYIGALVANHNHATTGDFGYTRKIVLPVQAVNSISENSSVQLAIYPNPATNEITFQLPETNPHYDFSITDLTGKTVMKQNSYSGKSLNVSQLPSAIYYLQIKTEGKFYSSKFQKQ